MMIFQGFLTVSRIVIQISLVFLGFFHVQVVGLNIFEGESCRLEDGSWGTCTKLPQCETLINGLSERTIAYSSVIRCSFIGDTELVCCGKKPVSENPIVIRPVEVSNPDLVANKEIEGEKDTSMNGVRSKTDLACEYYAETGFYPPSWFNPAGKSTSLGEFPHMVALGYPSEKAGEDIHWNCGGSLITETFVITAAHCIYPKLPFVIRMGTILLGSDSPRPVDLGIEKIFPHPRYTNDRQYHDIALIQINRTVQFNEFIRPACLNSHPSDIPPDSRVTVTGWGSHSKSFILLKTDLRTLDFVQCNNSHFTFPLNEGQICAFDPEGKRDVCEVDTGGPLQIKELGVWKIHGITSFGIGCESTIPGVYTKVSKYIDWIESIVWP